MIIATWGSYNSGKTVFSSKLGVVLSVSGKKTLIIYANIQSNDTICIHPKEKNFVSMGDVWQADLDEEEIFFTLMETDYDNLAYLTFAPGENVYSYPTFTKYNIVNALERLNQYFDYIIVDCSSDLNASVLTIVALEMADKVFRLIKAEGKDYVYFVNNLPIISDSRFNTEEHLLVFSDLKKGEAENVYERKYGRIDYKIYHDSAIERQYIEGEIMKKGETAYEKQIMLIAEDIIGVNLKKGKDKKKIKEKKEKAGMIFKKRRKEETGYGEYDE